MTVYTHLHLLVRIVTVWYIVAVLLELLLPGFVSSSINLDDWLILVVVLLGADAAGRYRHRRHNTAAQQ